MSETRADVTERPRKRKRASRGFLARQEARARKRRLWLNVMSILVTSGIISLTLLWVLAFILYNVSSNSMAPTLESTRGNRDRLLCWKLAFRYRKPRRWEVVVFQTPPSAANREIVPGFHTGGETGVTVKRVAGLPGERMAIAGGDVWTRPLLGDRKHVRQVKPDVVQRQLWINVFRQDFSEARQDAFLAFWAKKGEGAVRLVPDGHLSLRPDGGPLSLAYRPLVRQGVNGDNMVEMPGVSDRYVLRQEVQFVCRNPDCGQHFAVKVDNPSIVGICPNCSWLNMEDRVAFYDFRSGLSEIGDFFVGVNNQGDQQHFRAFRYNFVPDLRIRMEVRFSRPDAVCGLELSGDGEQHIARVGPAGATVDGMPVSGAAPKVGEWIAVEFYRVDGAVRLFLGDEKQPRFDRVLVRRDKPEPGPGPAENGASFHVENGEVAVRNLSLDRDVYYFGGRAYAIRNFMGAMDENNEVALNDHQFFPLGDNATVSLDGRSWGAVDTSLLRGTVLMIWNPPERRKIIAVPPEK